MNHTCDCGQIYQSSAGVLACQTTGHDASGSILSVERCSAAPGVRRLAKRLEGVVDQVEGALEDVKPSDALFAIADELTAINQQLAALEQRLERLLPGEDLKCDGCGSEYFVARCPKCGDGNAS